jgi:hypothetical protein
MTPEEKGRVADWVRAALGRTGKARATSTPPRTHSLRLDVRREVHLACIIDSEGHYLERHGIELSRSNLQHFAKERLRREDGGTRARCGRRVL